MFDEESQKIGEYSFLAQGTLYTDVIESGTKTAQKIKSHHNVGGLPEDMRFKLLEPLNKLFKDEVRKLGKSLGIDDELVYRQPFPGPGLGVRVVGELTRENVEVCRKANKIVCDEIEAAGIDKDVWQYFAVLTNTKVTGVQGDQRDFGYLVVVRVVNSIDAMTASVAELPWNVVQTISKRITSEISEVTHVALSVSDKPPATIEFC